MTKSIQITKFNQFIDKENTSKIVDFPVLNHAVICIVYSFFWQQSIYFHTMKNKSVVWMHKLPTTGYTGWKSIYFALLYNTLVWVFSFYLEFRIFIFIVNFFQVQLNLLILFHNCLLLDVSYHIEANFNIYMRSKFNKKQHKNGKQQHK